MSQQSFFDALANKSAAQRADETVARQPAKTDCDEDEQLIQNCIEVIRAEGLATVARLQRRLRLGYARAARIMDELEFRKIVGPSKGAEPRDILIECLGTCRKCGGRKETVNGFCQPCSAANE